jgi:hypothetical protein
MPHLSLKGVAGSLVVLAAAVAASPSPPSPVDDQPVRSIAPYVTWTGSYSARTKVGFLRITAEAEWAKVWQVHRGDQVERDSYKEATGPQIDFKNCMVIAFFAGQSWNTRSEALNSVDEFNDRVRLRIDPVCYQTEGPDGGGERVTPYAIYVLPRIAKPVIIEINTQDLIGAPPVWTEKARLEATHER